MGRATLIWVSIGVFLIASLLVPYDLNSHSDANPAPRVMARPFTLMSSPDVGYLTFHDEWEGQTERLLYDGDFGFAANPTGAPQTFPLAILNGVRVLPGTSMLNITETLTTASTPQLKLLVRPANDALRTLNLQMEGPHHFVVDERMNDWTPDFKTRWQLTLQSEDLMPVSGHIRIVAYRDPQAPTPLLSFQDRWHGHPDRVVYQETDHLNDATFLAASPASGDSAHPSANPTVKQLPATDLQQVRLTLYYNSTTPTQLHYRPLLTWHGADKDAGQWEEINVKPSRSAPRNENGSFSWDLAVRPNMWDSPFAANTRWGFQVNWYGSPDGGATLMEGNYHFVIRAIRSDVLPEPDPIISH